LSEALNLKWSELDGDKAVRLGFDNKGEQPRLVPLTDRAAEVIKTRRASRKDGEKRVWPDMSMDRAQYFWKLVREKLKLTKADDADFVIHACRHTFARCRLGARPGQQDKLKTRRGEVLVSFEFLSVGGTLAT
jgi:integrase